MSMSFYLFPQDASPGPTVVGGKAHALATLAQAGHPVPTTAALPTSLYTSYLGTTGIQSELEALTAKDLSELRWEAIWDHALRIRTLFMNTPLPEHMGAMLLEHIAAVFGTAPLAIRSSSPTEDGAGHAFAGLHESILQVQGESAILQAVRKVWASLWSDQALIYRAELGLEAAQSAMAVCIQPWLDAELSGVAFTRHPTHPERMVVEAVPGQGQALVEGETEPLRFILNRNTLTIVERHLPEGFPEPASFMPDARLLSIARLAQAVEATLGYPIDMEWVLMGQGLSIVQARPITTAPPESSERLWEIEDKRPWYRSLTRSVAALLDLRREVEEELIPAMSAEAGRLLAENLSRLDDTSLAAAIRHRQSRLRYWKDRYWERCIPLAHGVRLLGQVYADAVHPDDPFEFTQLLRGEPLASLARHTSFQELVDHARNDGALRQALQSGNVPSQHPFHEAFSAFVEAHGDLACLRDSCTQSYDDLAIMIANAAASPPPTRKLDTSMHQREELEARFFQAFPQAQQEWAAQVLELARASHRLRDDDNLPLDAMATALHRALRLGKQRLAAQHAGNATFSEVPNMEAVGEHNAEALSRCLEEEACMAPGELPEAGAGDQELELRLDSDIAIFHGDPAGPGMATGPVKRLRGPEDLSSLTPGDILVCQGFTPAMSMAAPMAAAIVEERGGMLIHGAILAREFGLPCVTGVRGAMEALHDGERVTVDGTRGEIRRLDIG